LMSLLETRHLTLAVNAAWHVALVAAALHH
jgi:hypothetical protein